MCGSANDKQYSDSKGLLKVFSKDRHQHCLTQDPLFCSELQYLLIFWTFCVKIPLWFICLFLHEHFFELVFNYSCPYILPFTLHCPTHPHLRHSQLHPHCLCPLVLYICSLMTLPLLCPFPPSTYRWDHMVFVFHCLVYFT